MTLRLGLGPVFAYEWLRATRRWTMYAWRAGFVLVLLGGLALVWLVWLSSRTAPAPFTMQAQADLAKMFFGIIECVAVVTVLLAAPAATAGVICQERARGTLLDVLATDLSSAEVVLGKLAARLLPVLATIAAALPVLAITSLFGGIDPGALGGSFAVIVGLAVLGCALALSLSLWGRKTHEVLLAMYFVWFGWLLLLPVWVVVTSHLAGRPLPSGWLVQTHPFMLTLFAHEPSLPWSPGLAAQLRFLAGAVVLAAGLVALTIWRLRPVCVGQSRQRATPRARSPRWRRPWAPTLDGNPVFWRECHRQPPSRWTRIVWGLYGVLALALRASVRDDDCPARRARHLDAGARQRRSGRHRPLASLRHDGRRPARGASPRQPRRAARHAAADRDDRPGEVALGVPARPAARTIADRHDAAADRRWTLGRPASHHGPDPGAGRRRHQPGPRAGHVESPRGRARPSAPAPAWACLWDGRS